MSARRILQAFERWRAGAVPLVLVTVVETEGSTYTKAGHRILLTGTGDFQGLVSGGCLEGDLAEHAREVLATGQSRVLTYDLRDENDDIWGLGIGCNGLFRVLLQPLLPDSDYAPFPAISEALLGDTPAAAVIVIESDDPALPSGATFVLGPDASTIPHTPRNWREPLLAAGQARIARRDAAIATVTRGECRARVLCAPLRPIPHLLVLGAGLDAVPLVDIASRLGWRVTIADHRPAYLARGDLSAAEQALHVAPKDLSRTLPLTRYAAAVVMSHHLETDREYLRALAAAPMPFVGLLGPAARRTRLLDELGTTGAALRDRLHGPVGLAIGADSPESIALAILAEIQATLSDRADVVAERARS